MLKTVTNICDFFFSHNQVDHVYSSEASFKQIVMTLNEDIKQSKELYKQVIDLTSDYNEFIREAKHIETGEVQCGSGGNMIDLSGKGVNNTVQHVNFDIPYKSSPMVILTQKSYKFKTHSTYIGLTVVPNLITRQGFAVVCHINAGEVYDWSYYWYSIPF